MAATKHDLPTNSADLEPCRIGDWTIFPDQNRLVGSNGEIRIEPRTMHALVCLVAQSGNVVPQSALLDVVWRDTVVSDGVLTRAISELRRILGDDARSPRYIETIYKSGYRLLLPMTPLQGEHKTPGPRIPGRLLLAGSVIVVIVAAMGLLGVLKSKDNTEAASSSASEPILLEGTPLTSTPGREEWPAFAPDGSRLAFCAITEGRTDEDIFIVQASGGQPRALLSSLYREMKPVWSPDGNELAYVRQEDQLKVIIKPFPDGPERVVASFRWWIWGMDWSPDGTLLTVAVGSGRDEKPKLVRIDLATGHQQALTSPPKGAGDMNPRYSPDGQSMAFVRFTKPGSARICVASLADGTAHVIIPQAYSVAGLDWSADGRFLIASCMGTEGYALQRIDPTTGQRHPLVVRNGNPGHLDIASETGSLVFEEVKLDVDLLAFRLSERQGKTITESRSLPALVSTHFDYSADYSPDGQRIAFASGRSGSRQVWIADRDGTNCEQITRLGPVGVERVRWSPDGQRIAFGAGSQSGPIVMIINAEQAREPRIIDTGGGEFEDWSQDGEWVYVINQDGGRKQLWRLPATGGQLELVLPDVSRLVHEDAAGRLYYRRANRKEIWRHDPRETEIAGNPFFPVEVTGDLVSAVIRETEVFLVCASQPTNHLIRFDPATVHSDTLVSLPYSAGYNLAVSPDGTEILMNGLSQNESDLIIVEDLNRHW